jgi:uncharacterized membrane protein YphA (DoxX/SURF4 family)
MSSYSYRDSAPEITSDGATRARSGLDRWLGFWFNPADLTTLGAVRICAGALFTFILFTYSINFQNMLGEHAWVSDDLMRKLRYEQPFWRETMAWFEPAEEALPDNRREVDELNRYYSEWEVDKRRMYRFGTPAWSIWHHVTKPPWNVVVHVCLILASILFTIGFCTRVTAVVVWLGAVSYVNRAVSTYFGMDTMMNNILIYLMIGGILGASGGALSVDRLLVRWWQRRSGNQAARRSDPCPSYLAQVSGNFVLRLIQINFCIIYMASGLSKLQGASWWNGNAMWGVSANAEFNPLYLGPYLGLLTFLCHHRWLWEAAMTGGAIFTLGLEISFSYLVWMPKWRWIMIIGAVMMHMGIALQMGLVGFSLSMLTMLLAFVPPDTVRRLADLIGEQLHPLVGRVAPGRLAA